MKILQNQIIDEIIEYRESKEGINLDGSDWEFKEENDTYKVWKLKWKFIKREVVNN